jgi:hypothetical protein
MAIKKLGMAMPTIVDVRAPKSSQLSGLMVEITPNGNGALAVGFVDTATSSYQAGKSHRLASLV